MTKPAERTDILDEAALVVIKARREATDMIRRSGPTGIDDNAFGTKCRQCSHCREYVGDGPVCTRTNCRHSASQHAT
ncbi:hypothetical protein QNN03_05585 [Streptomyces sp. GXMU-J15]|uniref:Uncharacterized protein n=1 Tax=Streptomyces fuscus TaxID=3048495 RepID=A0ABT7ITJ5_9ACTN|nr:MULTISPECIES: DUF6422 family protein [Streptomyces]MDL2075906.1 hypothetical protein [Streptomyces fuscus]